MENKSSKVNKCCKECLDVAYMTGEVNCVDLDCPCHKECCEKCRPRGWGHPDLCPCHSPTPDSTYAKVATQMERIGKLVNMKMYAPPDTIEEKSKCCRQCYFFQEHGGFCTFKGCACHDPKFNSKLRSENIEQLKCGHAKVIEDIGGKLELPCMYCAKFSPKNDNEDSWREDFNKKFIGWKIHHKSSPCIKDQFVIEEIDDYFSSLISKAKEKAYMEGAQDGFIQARQGVRAQTRADTKAEFIEKIKRFPTHEYEVDKDEGITSGEVINKDDLLTSLTKE